MNNPNLLAPDYSSRPVQHRLIATKERFAQYMTSSQVASFMAGLFSNWEFERVSLLDAGAGTGNLTVAFLDKWLCEGLDSINLNVTAVEIDPKMCSRLSQSLSGHTYNLKFGLKLVVSDFVEESVRNLEQGMAVRYTHCIMNPPYKKISSNSRHRQLLRRVGIEVGNIYAGFMALAILQLEPKGELVAIIPRSFCNGATFSHFRRLLVKHAAIRRIHLFDARDRAFRADRVLQENVIIHLECGGSHKKIEVSTSTDDGFRDVSLRKYDPTDIIHPADPMVFIHIPTDTAENPLKNSGRIKCSLRELGLEISTGHVVDFRLKQYLRAIPNSDTVPLLYPSHFTRKGLVWPRNNSKKPNALVFNHKTIKWVMPNGIYVVTRRFTAKEEKRRIVAYLVNPNAFSSEYLAFENHLNVIHQNRQGISEELARGIWIFLNSSFVDNWFRQFSGHTQVNATDIRTLKFPSRDILESLGEWSMEGIILNEEAIDIKIEEVL